MGGVSDELHVSHIGDDTPVWVLGIGVLCALLSAVLVVWLFVWAVLRLTRRDNDDSRRPRNGRSGNRRRYHNPFDE